MYLLAITFYLLWTHLRSGTWFETKLLKLSKKKRKKNLIEKFSRLLLGKPLVKLELKNEDLMFVTDLYRSASPGVVS